MRREVASGSSRLQAEQPLGPRRLDFTALSHQDFEELGGLVVLLDHPDATATGNPDGGADVLLPRPGGGWKRSWQAKHYPGAIHWTQCVKSLDRAVESYAIPRMTFLFPRNLTLKEQQEFQAKLVKRHDGVVVDHRGASGLLAKLIGSDAGLRIVDRYFGESPHVLAGLIEEVQLLRDERVATSGSPAAVRPERPRRGDGIARVLPRRKPKAKPKRASPPTPSPRIPSTPKLPPAPTPTSPPSGPAVRWLVGPDAAALVRDGFQVVSWPDLVREWVAKAREAGLRRTSLATAAHDYLEWLDGVGRLAVVDVSLAGSADAADLLGFVVEPAVQRGVELTIGADRQLDELDDERFLEPRLGYAYSLDRLRWQVRGERPVLGSPTALTGVGFAPDPAQQAAIRAGDGVVQVIGPAGSGKTSVLFERVRELCRRGVPPERILCLTFDRASATELGRRLADAGAPGVASLTFHGLGFRVLARSGEGPPTRPGGPTLAQWRMLAASVIRGAGAGGIWIGPADAQKLISDIKLGLLMTPDEYADSLTSDSDDLERAVAVLYREYEQFQRERDTYDFDDLLFRSVRLLRSDEQVRETWQQAYTHVLVDEYQEIEEARELLMRLIAAPHDQLFCVGNEDQAVYPFRRTRIERIASLDAAYPGLRRVLLSVDYRCPAAIVRASSRLIACNTVRFAKRIDPDPARVGDGADSIWLYDVASQAAAATDIAQTLEGRSRGQIAVLARTTNVLRRIVLACAELGVAIDGSEALFRTPRAHAALQEHMRLALEPRQAVPDLIRSICRAPRRYLASGAEQRIAAALRDGEPFGAAFADVRSSRGWLDLGELLTRLSEADDAAEAVRLLRGPGGLDRWFEEADTMGRVDQYERDALAEAERDAAGRTSRELLIELDHRAAQIEAIRDRDAGIELRTFFDVKGRQWPCVVLPAWDVGTLPHVYASDVTDEQRQRGEGIEAERRLAYVALTRAQQRLDIYYDKDRPSSFLEEAGLLAP